MTTLKLVKQEFFNQNAMRMLLNHNGISDLVKNQLKKYNKKRVNGNRVDNIIYEYKNKEEFGRLYCNVGLATFEKNVRNALAEGIYDDVDMVNAHPTILLQECKKYGWVCDKLNHYVLNREEVLQQVAEYYQVSRNEAKLLFNVIMFGGGVDTWLKETITIPNKPTPPFLQEYQQELKTIAINISTFNPTITKYVEKSKKPNKEARIMSYFLQTIEREILFAMIEGFAELKYEVDVPIHDGGFVRRLNKDIPLDKSLLYDVECYIQQKTGYNIKLEIKPITSNLVKPNEIQEDDFEKLDKMTLKDVRFLEDYKSQKYVFEKYFTKIENPPCYVEEKVNYLTNEINYQIWSLKSLTETYLNVSFIDNDGKDYSFISEWTRDKYIKTKNMIVFAPPPIQVDDNYLNVFNGYRIQFIDVPSSGNIQPFLTHINKLCNEKQQTTECIIKLLAYKLQNPGTKLGKAPVFIGSEGGGKNKYADIIKKIVGEKYVLITASPKNDILHKFNNLRLNKLFTFVNETDKQDTHKNMSLLKHMITDTDFNLEKKGVDSIPMKCYSDYNFFSNSRDCVKFDANNRRYIVCETSHSLIGNTEYFIQLTEYINDDRNIKAIYEYLMNLDVSDVNYTMVIPKSATHEAIEDENHDDIDLILELYYLKHRFVNTFKVEKPSKFYEFYVDNITNSDNAVNNKKFGSLIKILISTRPDCGISYHSSICQNSSPGYRIDIPVLQSYLKSKNLLKDTDPMIREIENNKFKCNDCDVYFDTKNELLNHINLEHR